MRRLTNISGHPRFATLPGGKVKAFRPGESAAVPEEVPERVAEQCVRELPKSWRIEELEIKAATDPAAEPGDGPPPSPPPQEGAGGVRTAADDESLGVGGHESSRPRPRTRRPR